MDKNFVNIDDLVRQRLIGAEEKERAGAWARMSELLDEEMPRKRGVFFWRNRYSALGILLLAGAIGLGGYELNSFRNMKDGNANPMVASALNTKNTISTGTMPVNGTSTNNIGNNTNTPSTNSSSSNTATPNTSSNTATTNTSTSSSSGNKPTNTSSNKTLTVHLSGNANTVSNKNSHYTHNTNYTGAKPTTEVTGAATDNLKAAVATNNSLTSSNPAVNQTVVASGLTVAADKHNNTSRTGATNPGVRAASGHTATMNETPDNISARKVASSAKTTAVKETNPSAATHKTETAKIIATSTGNDGKATEQIGSSTTGSTDGETTDMTIAGNIPGTENASTKTVADTRVADNHKAHAKKTTSEPGTVAVKVPKKTNEHKATKTAGETAAVKNPVIETSLKQDEPETGDNDNAIASATNKTNKATRKQNNLAVLSSSSSAGNRPIAVTLKPTTAPAPGLKGASSATAHPKAGNSKLTGNTAATTANHKNSKPANNTVVPGVVASSISNSKAGIPVSFTNKIPGPATAERKSEDKDIVKEMSIANARKQKRVIEKMVVLQRFLSNAPREHALHMDTISIESITEEYEVATAQVAAKAADEVATSDNPDMDSSPIKPMASSESFSTSMKEAAGKQTKGAKTLENLSAAFNDIKYNAGHATFAMGVTGGINRTFFGPNNFMGFQFGLYGALSFSQSLGLMAELKYFNRINNGFSLHDDYYQYTAQPGGGYKRELVSNPYDISTLHSIELPIAVRYTSGRFNFAVGPNVVYTFNINSGNYRTVDPNATSTFVSNMGNDNTGKIQASDFNSRFGLGYLFGVSYQVSPKVTIDLRDVQTLWDNAKTDGAKEVSSKLFRSPSFQLSLGYRLGGGKKE